MPSSPPSETLFKSSLRRSARTRPGPSSTTGSNADQWPPSLSASHLDPSQWTYLAEGGKNLLLRFDGDLQVGKASGWVNANGSRALALRLVKSERGQGDGSSSSSSSAQGPADSLPPRPDFEASVIAPLLGKEHLLPPTARISFDGEQSGGPSLFLEKVAARIELARPAERRRVAGVDLNAGFVDVVEDLTWAAPGDEVLAVEIKPKWLFPTGKDSRYKKHRVLKSQGQLTLEQWNALYDPLDLVSGDADRIHKATEALVEDWEGGGNNLRVFLGGQAVQDAKSEDFQQLLSKLHPETTSNKSSSSLLASLLKAILSTSDAQAVLQRLARLQSGLAPLDIKTLSTWWGAQTGGRALGQEGDAGSSSPSSLTAPPSLEEYREFARDWLQIQPRHDGEGDGDVVQSESAATSSLALTLRQAVLGTLLSATFKDCSLFLRLGPEQEDMTPSTSATSTSPLSGGVGKGSGPKQELQAQSLTSVTEDSSSSSTSLSASLSATASALLGSSSSSSSYLDPKLVGPHVGERNAPQDGTEHHGQHRGTRTETQSAAAVAAVGHTLRIIDVDAKPLRKLGYWLELEGQLDKAFELWKGNVGFPGDA